MGVALSIEAHLERALADAAQASGGGTVASTSDAYVLRPSNGVLEASDYLTRKHDWVQVTPVYPRRAPHHHTSTPHPDDCVAHVRRLLRIHACASGCEPMWMGARVAFPRRWRRR
jgi:hypothetical protein